MQHGNRSSHHTDELAQDIRRNPPKLTKDLLTRIFSYLRPYAPHLLLVIIAILIAAGLDLLPSLLTGRMIDEGFIGGNLRLLVTLVALSFGVHILSNLIGLLQAYLNAWVAQRVAQDMRNQMYAHLQRMSQRFFTANKQGDIITRMTSDISGVEGVITGTLVSTISNIAVLVTSVLAMYQKNWLLATVGMLIIPLFVLPTKAVGKRRWTLTLQSQKKNDEINQILNETLSVSGQQLVKLFTNEAEELKKYTAANEGMFRLRMRESMVGRWFRMAIGTFTSMGPMLIYLVGGVLILHFGDTTLSVGDITVMVALLTRMYRPVNQLLEVQVDLVRAMALFTRIFSYLDLPVDIKSKKDAISPGGVRGEIRFDDVRFGYTPEKTVLDHLSFQVSPGETVALVGPSGAGKSTIISLLTRLYDVNGGAITLDGVDLRNLDLRFLRQSIGVVTQEAYLFNGTLRENLLYANAKATQEDIENACRQANIHDFILTLPEGYDTTVGNRGVKLSGGERQRVSIARVILKDPKLLILDEATSSLDSISESLIQEAMVPLLRGRTSLVIAHRLSTIMSADKILVLHDGRIAQQGTHAQLLAREGMYKQLYNTQFKPALQKTPAP